MSYAILTLKPKRERSVLLRHPWVFSGAVGKGPKGAQEGDIIAVQDAEGNTLGHGFYSAKSQIVCRMFHWGAEAEDFQSAAYWQGKVARALDLRRALVINQHTNCYRLLHAEGDFFPGIIGDVYNEALVLQVLVKGVERLLPVIVQALEAAGFRHIYLKAKTSSQALEDIKTESGWLLGGLPVPVEALENGLRFMVDFIEGQKTGFFIDQRDNRALVGLYAKGRKVLNTFSYTGGFSLYALAGGASEVHSVDISKEAVQFADENCRLNFPDANHKAIAQDCFDFLKEMPSDDYDLIILDPPAFAKHARAVENACRGYKQINLRAFQKIRSGGLLFTFSCSQNISKELFQKVVFGAAADAGRNVRIVAQLHQPSDHPVNIYHPEGEYLKGLALWVE